jgi:hypothetical protein
MHPLRRCVFVQSDRPLLVHGTAFQADAGRFGRLLLPVML